MGLVDMHKVKPLEWFHLLPKLRLEYQSRACFIIKAENMQILNIQNVSGGTKIFSNLESATPDKTDKALFQRARL